MTLNEVYIYLYIYLFIYLFIYLCDCFGNLTLFYDIQLLLGCVFSSGVKTLLHEIDFPTFQDILSALMGAKETSTSNINGLTSSTKTVYYKIDEISQEKAKLIIAFVLSGVQLNNNLTSYVSVPAICKE